MCSTVHNVPRLLRGSRRPCGPILIVSKQACRALFALFTEHAGDPNYQYFPTSGRCTAIRIMGLASASLQFKSEVLCGISCCGAFEVLQTVSRLNTLRTREKSCPEESVGHETPGKGARGVAGRTKEHNLFVARKPHVQHQGTTKGGRRREFDHLISLLVALSF